MLWLIPFLAKQKTGREAQGVLYYWFHFETSFRHKYKKNFPKSLKFDQKNFISSRKNHLLSLWVSYFTCISQIMYLPKFSLTRKIVSQAKKFWKGINIYLTQDFAPFFLFNLFDFSKTPHDIERPSIFDQTNFSSSLKDHVFPVLFQHPKTKLAWSWAR